MNFLRKAALAAIASCGLLLFGCGSTFRPVANVIPQAAGNPTLLDLVAVLNQNPLTTSPLSGGIQPASGSFTLVDVDGDSNVGNFPVGVNTTIPVPPATPSLLPRVTFAAANSLIATADPDAGTVTLSSTSLPSSAVTLPATPNAIAATAGSGLVLVSLSNDTADCAPVPHGAVRIIQASTASLTSQAICLSFNPGFILVLPGDQRALVLENNNPTGTNAALINIPSATLLATLTVGSNPVWAASSQDGNAAYVLNKAGATITVVDVVHQATVGAAVSTGGSSPSMIVADHVLNRLYVSNTGTNSVAVFSALANTVLSLGSPVSLNSVSPGTSPIALAVTPDGSELYVANTGAASATVINTSTFAATLIPVPSQPAGTTATWLTVSKDGTRAYLTLVDQPADVGSGTAIVLTASNSLLIDSTNGKPAIIKPPPQDPASPCALNPADSSCATVTRQRPVQLAPHL